MKRLLLILLAMMLVACGGQPESVEDAVEVRTESDAGAALAEDPTATPEPEPTATPEPEPTDEPAPTEVPVEEVEESAEESEAEMAEDEEMDSAETADESTSDPVASEAAATTPQEANVLRANDYFKGAEDPDVVLIEYGDFQ